VVALSIAIAIAGYFVLRPSLPSTPLHDRPPEVRATHLPHVARVAHDDPRPDILLFTIDTVRADHVWSYGGSRHTTPVMTSLVERGAQFDRAYSASSWTAPGVTSILTGVLPSQHGVRHGFWIDAGVVAGQETLSPETPTLAALLHTAGYRTVGVTANLHLAPALGFERGFDSYTSFDFFTDCGTLANEVSAHVDELQASPTPYFLWVHLIEPHAPYRPRHPIFDTWWPATEPHYDVLDAFPLEEFLPRVFHVNHIPPARGREYVMAAYDSELHAADEYLGELLGQIDHEGLAVVVTSDHGEEFTDHYRFGHGHTAFEEAVRVPLIFVVPGTSATRHVPTPVSTMDVLPTLLELALTPPPSMLFGRSLLGAIRGADIEEREMVVETGRGPEVVRAIVSGHFKYGERLDPGGVQGLFDLETDPHEMHNLVEEQPEHASALRDRLHAILDAAAAQRPPTTVVPIDLTERQRDQLRALGYAQ